MEDVEDGEVSSGGFLGDQEIAARQALASAHGEGTGMSWVEAVLIGAGAVDPASNQDTKHDDGDGGLPKTCEGDGGRLVNASRTEPPPPGTSADKPPPSAAALARREAALVHRVMALLGDEEDAAEKLLILLAGAGGDGIDVPQWLGHGRSSKGGRTPLMEAAMQGRTACAAALAEAACACAGGRGLNARNERGRFSALHYACYHGNAGAALELLVRGADPRLRNREGETALQAALANGQSDCAEIVRDFSRRPTFEPDDSTPPPPLLAAPTVSPVSQQASSQPAPTKVSESAIEKENVFQLGVRAAVGGVAAVAPEVSRANTVFCLGRRRRRLGAGVRPGRGLGVGVGTALAEVSLGARRRARLHAANPCAGTSMEAFVLWSIASGHDPFHGEGGEEENTSEDDGTVFGSGNRANEVWLDYYIREYNLSVQRWHDQNDGDNSPDGSRRPAARQNSSSAANGGTGTGTDVAAQHKGKQAAVEPEREAAAAVKRKPVNFALVVKKSKALAEGRRFELQCGAEMVIGRSQHLAGIVVKDEMVSKTHLRIEISAEHGFRVRDLNSKHGAVITKPAPPAKTPPPKDAPPPPQKFFPIPIPSGPEWVAGAHGDRISLGKTTFVVEREGGPEPPRAVAPRRMVGGTTTAGAVRARVAAESKRPAAVISKGFTANPNLLDAIRSAEEMERARKRKAAASEAAAAATAAYLTNNKRGRSSTVPAVAAVGVPQAPPTGASYVLGANSTAVAVTGSGVRKGGTVEAQPLQGGSGDSSGFGHVSKGSMLLKQMGWTEGQGLGRRSDGQLQPVQVERRGEREGLGTRQTGNNPFAVGADGRISKWEQMRRRFTHAQRTSEAGYREKAQRSLGPGGWLRGGVEGGDD